MDTERIERLEAKSPERRLLYILQEQFSQPPRVAEVLVDVAQMCFGDARERLGPGQWTRVRRIARCCESMGGWH
jgi:hypothetical protein